MTTAMMSKTLEVTKTESMVLIKNMIRISVSSVCYIRDIFPSDCFKKKEYGSIDIHQLQGAHKDESGTISVDNYEAFLLTQWLEKGVFSALELSYLSALTFAVYSKHPITKEDILLETYEFRVTCPDNGPARVNEVDLLSKETVKTQAAMFIRSLTQFASTLDILPSERWITLQLKYNDKTPQDFEPEFFQPSHGGLLGSETLPLLINIGEIKTNSINLKVKFAGLESLLFEDLCKVNMPERSLITKSSGKKSIFSGVDKSKNPDPVKDDFSIDLKKMDVSGKYDEEKSPCAGAVDAQGPSHSADYVTEAITNYLQRESTISIKKCAEILKIDEKKVQAVIDRMVSDKVLQKNGRYAYKLIPVQSNGSACNAARSAPTNRIQLEQIITPDPVIIISPPPAPKKRHDDKQGVASASAGAPGSSTKSRSLQQFYSDDENDMAGPVEETCTDEIQTFTQKPIEKIKVVPVANRFKKANGNALELRRPEKKRDRGGDEVAVVDNNMDVVVDQVQEESLSQEASLSLKRARKYSIIKDPIYLTREKIIQT